MIIAVNRDGTIATVTPSVVYQGSNQASELAVFAPFSIANYSAVTANVELPSGEILAPLLVLPTETQPTGLGAWSALLPASVTALSGTVKVSLCFYGSGYTIDESTGEVTGSGIKIPTEVAEITVRATVPSLPVDPAPNIYEQILSAYSALVTDFDSFSRNIYTNRITVVNDTGTALQVLSEGGAIFGERPTIIADPPEGAYGSYDVLNYSEIVSEISGTIPTWTTNINTTDASAKIIPPTTEAVKGYVDTTAANVLKNTVSGRAVSMIDVSPYDLNLLMSSTPTIPGVNVFGRNILDASKAAPPSSSYGTIVYNSPGNITWKAGSTYYVKIPVHIPSGCVVSFSIKYQPTGTNSGDTMGRVRFSTSNLSTYVYSPTQPGATSGTFVVPEGQTVEYMQISKSSGGTTALVNDVIISEICVNLTNEAIYTEYMQPAVYNGSITSTPLNLVLSEDNLTYGGATVFPYDPNTSTYIDDATLTIEYVQDTNKVIERMQRQIAALQNAIAT